MVLEENACSRGIGRCTDIEQLSAAQERGSGEAERVHVKECGRAGGGSCRASSAVQCRQAGRSGVSEKKT